MCIHYVLCLPGNIANDALFMFRKTFNTPIFVHIYMYIHAHTPQWLNTQTKWNEFCEREDYKKQREKFLYFGIDSNLYVQSLILFQNHLTTGSVIHPFRCPRRSHLLII